jgi:hypothetical protein
MGLLACVVRPSAPALGRPLCSFLPSPGDMVPMVPILISSPRVLGKRALSPDVLDIPIWVKLLSALPDIKWFVECYLAMVEC